MTWEAMESAPKDGSRVLAWREGWDNPRFVRWVLNGRTGTEFWNDADELDAYELEREPPTHWLEIPAPPGRVA